MTLMKKVNLQDALEKVITSLNVASRMPIYEKYDKNVQGNTAHERGKVVSSVITPFMDFDELDDDSKKIGVTIATGGNALQALIDPKKATEYAVCMAALKVKSIGGAWIGATDCLNYGNPEKEYQMSELVEGIEGVKKSCSTLEIPIVSGNVSLYNESAGNSIPPSGLISLFGRVDEVSKVPQIAFGEKEQTLWYVGHLPENLSASEFLDLYNESDTNLPEIDYDAFKSLCDFVEKSSQDDKVSVISPIQVGGLWATVCQSAFGGKQGFVLDLEKNILETLFGENLGCLMATDSDFDVLKKYKNAVKIGKTQNNYKFDIQENHKSLASGNLEDLETSWNDKLREIF